MTAAAAGIAAGPVPAPPADGVTAWTGRHSRVVMNTYGPPRTVLVRGEGCYVWDADGRRYLDLLAGIAVNALGHAHPALVAAVTTQIATLGHVSNFFATRPQIALAERLGRLLVEGVPTAQPSTEVAVFFSNSGAEANEAAFKVARRTGRRRIVAAEGGFHGRTMGALALTGQPAKRAPFEPLPGDVTFVPYGDVAALTAAVDDDTAAVILEPIQGERGVLPAPAGYLAAARDLTTRHGALLVLDEVQTGIGRTGHWFAAHHHGVMPDVITLAKGLGGGIPIGACVALGPAASLLGPGQHGSTFGGNPVAAAAALAVLDTIERDGLLAHVRALGDAWSADLAAVGHPLVAGVRGAGLLRGLALTAPVAGALAAAALDAGFIVNDVAPDTIRLAPPLILDADQAAGFTAALPDLLTRALAGSGDRLDPKESS